MSERFKFRAWLKDEKVMVDVEQIDFYNNTIAYIFDNYAEVEQEWIEEDIQNVELLQHTGLKDKNGVEIYEGDILSSEEKIMTGAYVVVYKDFGFLVEYRFNIRGYDEVAEIPLRNMTRRNVIGNIYENTELLEVTK